MCVSYTEPGGHPSASRLHVLIVLLASMLFCLFLHHSGISLAESLIYCIMTQFFPLCKGAKPKARNKWMRKEH